MKPRWIVFIVLVVLVAGFLLAWHPWSRLSIDQSSVVLEATPGVAAPAGRDDVMAVVYSGDGGWADLDKQLGNDFAESGIPVLGISTFKYYWHERSPEASARDLDEIMTRYLTRWNKKRIWLVGFSFGADVLPSIVERLSPANRSRITQMVLLSPSHDVNFEIELEGYMISGWFASHVKSLFEWINPVRHYDSKPLLLALDGQPPVVCYYPKNEDTDSVCDDPGLPPWIVVHPIPGDHHLGGDYHALARRLLDGMPPR